MSGTIIKPSAFKKTLASARVFLAAIPLDKWEIHAEHDEKSDTGKQHEINSMSAACPLRQNYERRTGGWQLQKHVIDVKLCVKPVYGRDDDAQKQERLPNGGQPRYNLTDGSLCHNI